MKKNFKALSLLLAVAFLFSGCVKYEVNMNINADKSGSVGFIMAVDTSALSAFGGDSAEDGGDDSDAMFNPDDYKSLEGDGWKVESYSEKTDDSDFNGVRLIKELDSIDNYVSESLDSLTSFGSSKAEEIAIGKLFTKDGNVYTAKYNFDLGEATDSADDYGMDLSSMFAIKFVVNLPVKALSNNADEVSADGKTLTWDLVSGANNGIEYSFDLGGASGGVPVIPIVIAIAAIILILVIVLVIVRSRKNKPTTTDSQ